MSDGGTQNFRCAEVVFINFTILQILHKMHVKNSFQCSSSGTSYAILDRSIENVYKLKSIEAIKSSKANSKKREEQIKRERNVHSNFVKLTSSIESRKLKFIVHFSAFYF